MNTKIKVGIVLGIFMISLVGICGCTGNTQTTQNANDTSVQTNAGVTVKLSFVGMQKSLDTYTVAASGKQYAVYTATVKNINAGDRTIDPLFFTLRDTKGGVYDADLWASSGPGTLKTVSKSQPGDSVTGKIAFEVPTGITPKSITYNDYYDTITTNLK